MFLCLFGSSHSNSVILTSWQQTTAMQQSKRSTSFILFLFPHRCIPFPVTLPPSLPVKVFTVCLPSAEQASERTAPLWSPSSFAFDNTDNPTTRSPHSNLRLHTHTAHTFVCASPSHTNALVHTYARCQPSPWQLQSAKALFPLLQRRYDSFPLLPSALLGIWLFLLFPPLFSFLPQSLCLFLYFLSHTPLCVSSSRLVLSDTNHHHSARG